MILYRIRGILLIIIALNLHVNIYAQDAGESLLGTYSSEEMKNLVPQQTDSAKLWASKLVVLGDNLISSNYNVDKALHYYFGAYEHLSGDARLNYQIGKCLLNSVKEEKTAAVPFLQRALMLGFAMDDSLYYYLGRGYQLNNEWKKAEYSYREFQDRTNDESWSVVKHINECEHGARLSKQETHVVIKNMGLEVNSRFADFTPLVDASGKRLFFTSRRHDDRVDDMDIHNHLTEHIYTTTLKNGEWERPMLVKNLGDIDDHNATVSLSDDSKHIVIFKDADLYVSHRDFHTDWSKPKKLPHKISSEHLETSACFNVTGDTLYFVSDRPVGSVGAMDIYWVARDKSGKWGDVHNIGEHINTLFDEEGVFVTADGTALYFSSKGHDSIGGYDIFKCNRQADGTWGKPVNMGLPLNSPDDDVYFVLDHNGKHGYYSSARKGGFGEKDIYAVTLLGEEKELPFDMETDYLLEDKKEVVRHSSVNEDIDSLLNSIFQSTWGLIQAADDSVTISQTNLVIQR